MKKRGKSTSFLIKLRKLGVICKSKPPSPKVKISHTIYPDDRKSIPSIEIARNTFILNKISARVNCSFNTNTESCDCGADVTQFLKECIIKK